MSHSVTAKFVCTLCTTGSCSLTNCERCSQFQETPGEGFLRKTIRQLFFYLPALLNAKVFRTLRSATGASPLDPTSF